MKPSPMGLVRPALWSLGALLLVCLVPTQGAVDDLSVQCCRCGDMMPEPKRIRPQTMPSPFKIVLKKEMETYSKDTPVEVTLKSVAGAGFRAFMLVAHEHEEWNPLKTRSAKGTFEPVALPSGYNIRYDCFNTNIRGPDSNAVFSQSNMPVTELKFKWIPRDNYGPIEFRATFVYNDTTYWVREVSDVLFDESDGVPPKRNVYTPPINTQDCGRTKGCYRVPEGCIEPQCYYILTWRNDHPYIHFELGGLTEGHSYSYVAAAMSDDTYVGDDVVFVCAHNMETTEVYFGKHNDEYETKILPKYIERDGAKLLQYPFLEKESGSFMRKRLQCRFTVKSDLGPSELKSLRGWKAHLIMSRGLASDGMVPHPMGVGYDNFPRASEDKVVFTETSDNSGQASYPLVKAHGCLMILAWILFSSVGFLLAKYYQPMWPEKRMYDRKYWFAGHFKAMTMVFILVVIAIILIFIEADGYTYARDLPYKAHPILGIIIFVCVLILPLIALLRPGKGHDCRNVFNWLYWIFATIANVLAVPNIFIGMNFGKAAVPWWATWILVFWVIFHIIVEITLEIHQCVTHKKNKEKRKKHELLKRDYPKQHHPMPEPAGRRFKRFMLLLHLAITILIVLIMIIVIAVS